MIEEIGFISLQQIILNKKLEMKKNFIFKLYLYRVFSEK